MNADPSPLPAVSLAVVGIEYDNADGSNRRFALSLCDLGDAVELRLEPKNPADENAVAVHTANGMQIGYITSVRAVRMSAILREGRELRAVLQRRAHFGAWIRVAFDGEEPQLTPAMMREEPARTRRIGDDDPDNQVRDDEPDFYRDEVWPDE